MIVVEYSLMRLDLIKFTTEEMIAHMDKQWADIDKATAAGTLEQLPEDDPRLFPDWLSTIIKESQPSFKDKVNAFFRRICFLKPKPRYRYDVGNNSWKLFFRSGLEAEAAMARFKKSFFYALEKDAEKMKWSQKNKLRESVMQEISADVFETDADVFEAHLDTLES